VLKYRLFVNANLIHLILVLRLLMGHTYATHWYHLRGVITRRNVQHIAHIYDLVASSVNSLTRQQHCNQYMLQYIFSTITVRKIIGF
jgi:hypothetical protein